MLTHLTFVQRTFYIVKRASLPFIINYVNTSYPDIERHIFRLSACYDTNLLIHNSTQPRRPIFTALEHVLHETPNISVDSHYFNNSCPERFLSWVFSRLTSQNSVDHIFSIRWDKRKSIAHGVNFVVASKFVSYLMAQKTICHPVSLHRNDLPARQFYNSRPRCKFLIRESEGMCYTLRGWLTFT